MWARDGSAVVAPALVGGLAVMVTGAATGFLAPGLSDDPPFVAADLDAMGRSIASNPAAWRWANGLIVVGVVLTVVGVVALAAAFTGAGRAVAAVAAGLYLVAAPLEVASRGIAMEVATWAATAPPDSTQRAVWRVAEDLGSLFGTWFMLLAFVSVATFGLAASRESSDGFGAPFLAVGGLGVLLELVGATIPLFAFLATASLSVLPAHVHGHRSAPVT